MTAVKFFSTSYGLTPQWGVLKFSDSVERGDFVARRLTLYLKRVGAQGTDCKPVTFLANNRDGAAAPGVPGRSRCLALSQNPGNEDTCESAIALA
jgi:hypothetical protein